VTVGVTLAIGLAELGGRRLIVPAIAVTVLGAYAVIAPLHYFASAYPSPALLDNLTRAPSHTLHVTLWRRCLRADWLRSSAAQFPPENQAIAVTYYWRTLEA